MRDHGRRGSCHRRHGSISAAIDEHRGWPVKRRAITDAAARVFVREGFDRASVDAIAAEAGVSKRTVYNHFGDKENLFSSVIQATLDSVLEEASAVLDETLAESEDLQRDLVVFARRFVRLFLRDDVSALRRLLMAEAVRHPELLAGWLAAGRDRGTVQIARILGRLVDRGKLELPDPVRAAWQLTLLMTMEPWQQSAFGTIALSDRELDAILVPNVELFLRAHEPRPVGRRGASRAT